MKVKSRIIACAVAVALTGCVTSNSIPLTVIKGGAVVRDVTYDPVMLSGLMWTKDLQAGNFVTIQTTFPETAEAYAEFEAFVRVRYQAHAIGEDGREYVANSLFAGFEGCQPRYITIVEGLKEIKGDVKIVNLSTLLDRAYTAFGTEIPGFDPAKFQTDAAYRKEFVLREGTALNVVRPMTGMQRAFENWTIYTTQKGELITPLDEKKVDYLKRINPMYSGWEKFKGTARLAIPLPPDAVMIAVSLMFDVIESQQAKSAGWDHGSVMRSRLHQGFNLKIFERLRAEGELSCMAAIAAQRNQR